MLAVVTLGATFDPELIVLSGDLIEKGGDELVQEIRKKAIARIKYSDIRVEKTNLGNRVGIVGACSMVYEHAFHVPIVFS